MIFLVLYEKYKTLVVYYIMRKISIFANESNPPTILIDSIITGASGQ